MRSGTETGAASAPKILATTWGGGGSDPEARNGYIAHALLILCSQQHVQIYAHAHDSHTHTPACHERRVVATHLIIKTHSSTSSSHEVQRGHLPGLLPTQQLVLPSNHTLFGQPLRLPKSASRCEYNYRIPTIGVGFCSPCPPFSCNPRSYTQNW